MVALTHWPLGMFPFFLKGTADVLGFWHVVVDG